MANVLEALLNASEKAANVARSCCGSSNSETLLVAEKCEGEANARFDKDFKTIADVLAQESAKNEIIKRLPELIDNVRGEECSEINGICIGLQETCEKTAELLSQLVPSENAKHMAEAAHNDITQFLHDKLPSDIPFIDPNDLGVWIDPIDATAEFIAGVRGETTDGKGLPCVTVLIGAYLRSNGEPVVGVVNQPFYNNGKGRIVWGVNYNGTSKWHGEEISESNIVLMSGAEKPDIIQKFKNFGWEVKSVPGAGHKLLKVALGEAAAYIVSQGTTFRWDTCAPHSVIRAKGGDVLSYSKLTPITYNDAKNLDTQEYCNSEGGRANKVHLGSTTLNVMTWRHKENSCVLVGRDDFI